MDEKKAKEPSIRFAGFHDTWEQRKFDNIASRKSNSNESTDELPSVEYEDIISGRGLLNKNVYDKETSKTGIKFDEGDVLFGKLRPYLKNWLKPNFPGIAVGDFWVLEPQNMDSSYLYYLIQTPEYDNVANQSSGTKMPRSDWKLVSNTAFNVPVGIDEQQKIGEYFTNLDNLITLHQRELELLKENKKTMLQKMFPREGAEVPEIRFAGFNGAWEQRKLGEVAKYRNGKAHENDISEDGKYVVVNSKFVSTDGKVKKFSNQQIEPLYKGELAFVLSDVPNGRAIARTFLVDKDYKYSLNQRIAGITPLDNSDSYFLHVLMNRHPYFLRFDDGAKQTNLSVNDVMEFETYYPSFDEQAKIGVYFLTLDNLINLNQRELDTTKQFKKSMLQKMFI